jgi:mono/diheme cytochrome c family protein
MRKSGALSKYALILAGAWPVAWLGLAAGVAQGQEALSPVVSPVASPSAASPLDHLATNYCEKCHNTTDWAGSLAMDSLDLSHTDQDPEVWEKAITKLRGRLMPPAGKKQPDQAEIDAVIHYLETSLDAAAKDQAAAKNERVGYVPIQRLNRTEFTASVKDLVGVQVDPKQILPTVIEVEGFSNIAGALGISPSFMEQYLSAARHVAQRAVGEPIPKTASVFYGGGGGGGGQAGLGSPTQLTHKDGYPLGTRGGVSFTHVFPADGEYRFNFLNADSFDAGLYPRGMETAATLVILVDGVEVARREIGGPDDLAIADRDGPKGREALTAKVSGIPAQIKAGAHTVTATFIERSWALSNEPTAIGSGKVLGMPIIRDGIQVVGPFSPQGLSLSASRARIFICQPKTEAEERPCAQAITRHLATEAFRRPVTDTDVKVLMKFYDTGRAEAGGFDSGVTELVTAILSSPDFLYRAIETSRAPNQSRQLSDLELASRLSFLLWSEGPDEQLIGLAANKTLSDSTVLQAQVERMLEDPRALSLVNNFAFSWLNLGTLQQVEPDDKTFTADMRTNFETEARLFLASVLLENRSVLDLINGDWTYVNEALARQYDIPGVFGPQFRRVTLTNENRWGLLGKGAVQLRTSYGDRTSPVLRGAYVLDRIMGTPPTPPPPGVNTDLSIHLGQKPTTVRARLEAHRANPTCQACHGVIDPLGLALENFDNTGRWRNEDTVAKESIDTATTLSSGVVLHGPTDLRRYLNSRPDQFPTTVTKRLMMYALNRELEYYDMPEVRQIVRAAAASNYTFASIITGVVNSDAFRRQGPEAPPKGGKTPATKVASTDTRGSIATQPLQER